MPELPEVETIATTLYPHVYGSVVSGVRLLRPSSLHPLSLPLEKLIGAKVADVGRRGKLLIFRLTSPIADAPQLLVAHLRMTGRLLTKSADAAPEKHTRCIFGLATANGESSQLFFDDIRAFGQLLAATQDVLERWPFWRDLGPEPLEIGAAEFGLRLQGSRPLKTALMDQKVVAGIGNIYADESLFQAGLLPTRAAGSLSANESATLLAAIQAILRKSIAQCGSSIRDYRDADGNMGSFQKGFQVYGRGGENCKKCGAMLQKVRLGGRSTVFCPNCQK